MRLVKYLNLIEVRSKKDFHQPRRFFVGGNWKMNGNKADIDTIVAWMSK